MNVPTIYIYIGKLGATYLIKILVLGNFSHICLHKSENVTTILISLVVREYGLI